MNCLIVNGDWIDRILSGEKTVETSGRAPARGDFVTIRRVSYSDSGVGGWAPRVRFLAVV